MAGTGQRQWRGLSQPNASVYLFLAGTGACLIASLVTYRPRLHDYFVFDDFIWLRAVRNHSFPHVMARAFTFPQGAPFDEVTLFWRPLADFYFYLARPFGLDPTPYHTVNLIAHGFVGGLAVLLLWRLGANALVAAASSLLFVMAPTYDFAVVWISEISEMFGAIAILCALLSYRHFLTEQEHVGLYRWSTVVFVVFGFLSKESTVILLALLPALATATPSDERRREWPEIAISLAPIYALGCVFGIVMYAHQAGDVQSYEIGPHIVRNAWNYLRWMVLPLNFGSYDAARSVLAATFVVAGIGAIARGRRLLGFLFAWTIIALLPFSGFSFGIELRYTYLATLPFTAFVVVGIFEVVGLGDASVRLPAYGALGLAVCAALVVTPMRTRDFQQFIIFQQDGYQRMVDAVTHLCAPLEPGTQVYLKGVPYHDSLGTSTQSALNLYTHGVRAYVVEAYPELIAFVEPKCALEFDRVTWSYHRVTEF